MELINEKQLLIAIRQVVKVELARVIRRKSKSWAKRQSIAGVPKTFMKFSNTMESLLSEYEKTRKIIGIKEIYNALLGVKDRNGELLFVKAGVPMEYQRFKQYLTPSQIKRQKRLNKFKFDNENKVFVL